MMCRADPNFVEFANPQFRAIPWHLRMTPARPRKAFAVGTDSREGVKVVAFENDSRAAGTVGRHADDLIDRLAALFVAFPHTKYGLAIRCDAPVCITQACRLARLGCDDDRLRFRFLPIQTLIFEVREENSVLVNEICLASILVGAAARAESLRNPIVGFAVG